MLLQNLRKETASFHAHLEQNQASVRLMSADVTLEDYKAYLSGLYGYIKMYESVVLPRLEQLDISLNIQRKVPFLEADLLLLSCEPTQIPVVEEDQIMATYPGIESALGGLYVLEGSMLGGAIITRHLQKYLGIQVAGRLQYLGAYGAVPGINWKSFLELFCNAAVNLKEDKIIEGAKNTYQSIDQWLNIMVVDAT